MRHQQWTLESLTEADVGRHVHGMVPQDASHKLKGNRGSHINDCGASRPVSILGKKTTTVASDVSCTEVKESVPPTVDEHCCVPAEHEGALPPSHACNWLSSEACSILGRFKFVCVIALQNKANAGPWFNVETSAFITGSAATQAVRVRRSDGFTLMGIQSMDGRSPVVRRYALSRLAQGS